MPDKERQDKLSELVVREAVGKGMESPMRETIVEAVEEAEGRRSKLRALPLAGVLVGAGAAIGYAAGLRSRDGDVDVGEIEAPEVVSEAIEETTGDDESTESGDSGGGRLGRLAVLAAAAIAGVAIARRFRSGEEEWEPIDEFETAVDEGETEGVADETDEGETGEADETEESDEGEEIEEAEESEGTEE